MGELQKNKTIPRKALFGNVVDYDVFIEIEGSGPYMIMTHGLGVNTNTFQLLTEISFPQVHCIQIQLARLWKK